MFRSLTLAALFILMLTGCANEPKQQALPAPTEAEKAQHAKTFATAPPEWSKNLNIYEVNLRQYTKAGTFAAFEQELPRLQEMGVGILWFMPIHPIGQKNRKGKMGSYYSVKDYQAVAPEYGTLDDFKRLVEKAHKMRMFVIIDWVANHTSWDNVWTTTNPDFYTKNEKGKFKPPVDDWSDVIDLNFDNPNLRKAMIEAMQFWLRETNIDGFRCDVAEMVPPDFWKEATTALRQQKPDIFMLAEAEKPEMHQYFDMTYSWEMHHVWNEVAQGKKTVADIDSVIEKYADNYHPSNYRMYFTSNHDENSWKDTEYGCLGAGAEAFAALTYFLPGMPLIYSGQEAANKKKLQFFEKDAIVWPSKPYPLANFYTQLNRMKLQMPALHNGSFGGNYTRLKTGVDTQVLAFSRAKDNNQIIVVFNLSDKPAVATLEVGNVTGDLIEVFANKKLSAASKIPLNLTPWEHRVFLVSK